VELTQFHQSLNTLYIWGTIENFSHVINKNIIPLSVLQSLHGFTRPPCGDLPVPGYMT